MHEGLFLWVPTSPEKAPSNIECCGRPEKFPGSHPLLQSLHFGARRRSICNVKRVQLLNYDAYHVAGQIKQWAAAISGLNGCADLERLWPSDRWSSGGPAEEDAKILLSSGEGNVGSGKAHVKRTGNSTPSARPLIYLLEVR